MYDFIMEYIHNKNKKFIDILKMKNHSLKTFYLIQYNIFLFLPFHQSNINY